MLASRILSRLTRNLLAGKFDILSLLVGISEIAKRTQKLFD